MKTLITFLLLLVSIQAYTLEKSYTYDSPTLYATDFFSEIDNDFEVVTIPSHLQHFQLSQTRIYELFKRNGILLEGKPLGVVKFRRYSALDLSELEEKLRAYYLENLPFLDIKSVTVQASRHIKKLPRNYQIDFKKQLFKHNKGSFKITSDTERIFFKFTIDATYSQFQANRTLQKGAVITAENTKMVILPFKRTYNPLIGFEELSHVEAKHYLKKGKPITLRDVKAVQLIKKGSIVNVKLIEGNILIHFTAKALKGGNLAESISIKKSDGSKLTAKITGKNEVTIE